MRRPLPLLAPLLALLLALPALAAVAPLAPAAGLARLRVATGGGEAPSEAFRDSLEIEGYGEAVVRAFDRARQDGRASHLLPDADLLRVVLGLERRFSSELTLQIEYAWTHAGVADAAANASDSTRRDHANDPGESTIDLLALDWTPTPSFGVRAGKLLIPLGFENEGREPPDYLGSLRTDVETRILPTTWGALGAGVFGELPRGFSYRAYVVEGLDASRFSAASAIRDGRQDGARAKLTHPAIVGRLDWDHASGLAIGAAAYTGDAWQDEPPATGRIGARVSIGEAHASLARGGLRARAMYAMGALWDHAALSRVLGVANTSDALGSRFFGGYVEAGYDVLPAAFPGTTRALIPFARWEESDTQDGVGDIGTEDPSRHWNTLTAGLSFVLHPDVVLKADRQQRRNETHTATSQWNVAVGYRF